VVLSGLQSQPELNGKVGVIRGFNAEKGRYTVDVEGRERAVRLKSENVFIPAVPVDHSGTSQDFVIDVAGFMDSATAPAAERRLVAASWDATFRSIGFARIVGHGVSAGLISELRAAAKAFFDKPESEKLPYHRPAEPGQPVIGSFNPLFGSRVPGGHNDPVEGYTFYRQHNGWPLSAPELSHPPELAAVAERYCAEVERVMHALHRLSAASLGLKPSFFDSTPGTKLSSLLVLSHYPPIEKLSAELEVEDGQPRYRAHSDYTGFTILLQDEDDHDPDTGAGGLEIDIAGDWMPVRFFSNARIAADTIVHLEAYRNSDAFIVTASPCVVLSQVIPRPNSFVINIGDLFELWTNNRWRSTPHRVSSPRVGTPAASRSRITAMLFSGPSLETIVGPAPTCGPSLYPTVTARQHLTAMAMTKSKEAQYKKVEEAKTAAAAAPNGSSDM
jgi:isopenicillin N synthase-like dioxygenase